MKFKLEFNMENDAFNNEREKIYILKNVIERLEMGDISGRIMDTNGNKVGSFGIEKEPEK